ncbi:MAG: alanyl-tRNA synthetase [Parcubacteria group bacterium Gr01-1014_46]|nr:MAG: alanyl-tRNA synthetase [Parcubacteria group bacterium Gr01-1014_46]
MTSNEIRQKFLHFFEKRGHKIIPSASLVPENDPSVLFNTAGMQPLVPYLLGQEHPQGKRLVNIQKCVRTNDIDEVGDNTHLTFFEMMGNWSLGDYWKTESINWSYELLTSKEEGFGLDPQRLYVTCFEGDENAPKDEETAQIWKEIFEKNGVTGERIYFRPKEKNWWSAGPNGPCGPDTEMFYDLTGELNSGMTLDEYLKADDEQKVVEIWNNVFMQFLAKDGKVVSELPNKNVDTGAGFERIVAVVQGKKSVFETDIFEDVMKLIKSLSITTNENELTKGTRVLADHIRTSIFLISDGVTPSNTEKGYILRRLIRMAIRWTDSLSIEEGGLINISEIFIKKYKDIYPNLFLNKEKINEIISNEEGKFRSKLKEGVKYIGEIDPFILYTSYGIPFELTDSILIAQKKERPDYEKFKKDMKEHQELSRVGSEQKFKGGLSGTGEMETKYHTATHLLHQALRDVLGETVSQKGSNITTERTRFDFAFDKKLTDEEKQKVEKLVNEKIQANLPVNKVVMKKEDAEKTGAHHFFGDKYGDEVNVYYIGNSLENAYSKEFCGGPHVENTGVLGNFKIIKEEAVSAGVRRIKAILE